MSFKKFKYKIGVVEGDREEKKGSRKEDRKCMVSVGLLDGLKKEGQLEDRKTGYFFNK